MRLRVHGRWSPRLALHLVLRQVCRYSVQARSALLCTCRTNEQVQVHNGTFTYAKSDAVTTSAGSRAKSESISSQEVVFGNLEVICSARVLTRSLVKVFQLRAFGSNLSGFVALHGQTGVQREHVDLSPASIAHRPNAFLPYFWYTPFHIQITNSPTRRRCCRSSFFSA